MSDTLVFEIRKSSDISRTFAVEVLPKNPSAPDFVFASADVKAFDGLVDVTSDVIDTSKTSVVGNKIKFRVKGGQNGKVYLIKAVGTLSSPDGDVEAAWGTLVVVDPEVT